MRSDGENDVLQWIGALDMLVMGACRADERLKPLLKLNVSTDMAEDRLLTYLSQSIVSLPYNLLLMKDTLSHRVGHLAKCLCVPLVSIRVGKINKQGTFLSPTSKVRMNVETPREDVNYVSDASLFLDSDPLNNAKTFDRLNRMALSILRCGEGRRGNLCLILHQLQMRVSFIGDDGSMERLATLSSGIILAIEIEEISRTTRKMKDMVMRKPSLAELSGISEARSIKLLRKSPSNLSSLDQWLLMLIFGGFLTASPPADDSIDSINFIFLIGFTSFISEKDKLPVANGINPFSTLNFVDAFGKSAELPFSAHKIQVPSSGQSHFSPQYCWCPQYALGNSQHLPVSSTESLSLPLLSSLLSAVRRPSSSLLTSITSLNLTEVPPIDFPSLLPEPLVRLQTLQNIPTFTPLMCDPIVHVPMFEVCSSGSGYLVSAGPTMSTTFPPLNLKLVDPLLPNPESLLEKSARETLRMLVSNDKQNVFALEVGSL
ncbi:hypothetical protein DH2020_030425 [Rehmannia glutinosa]|uniref:PH domain-containing protein n=1 Tax=Rehmannia glutinosa TaxID=99300 RepID=A0ABR0VLK9_REHGL